MQVLKRILRTFVYKQVGTDPLGNAFFESKKLNQFGRTTRFVAYKNKNANDESMDNIHTAFDESAKLHVSWQNWLRHTRKEPPIL